LEVAVVIKVYSLLPERRIAKVPQELFLRAKNRPDKPSRITSLNLIELRL